MKLYCGIDLHSSNNVVAVSDEQDRPLYEKRLSNDLDTILTVLKPFKGELIGCVVESTYHWYWLVDGLMAAGFPVRLAHTGAMAQYAGLKYTNDFSDARYLAHLLRLGILPTGYIYPKKERGLRDLLRRRLLLVRQKTLHHLSLQSLIARHSGQRLTANEIKQLETTQIAAYLDAPILLGGQITLQARCWLVDRRWLMGDPLNSLNLSGVLQRHTGVLITLTHRYDKQLAGKNPGALQLIDLAQPCNCRPAVLCNGT